MAVNKHGLSRHIPEKVKRIIRQNSGFGCVVCGNFTTNYEHVDPEFKDAKIHDPEKMTLLCATCHDKVTRRRLSKASVKRAMENPRAKQNGFANEWFDLSDSCPIFYIGSCSFVECWTPIRIEGIDILRVDLPEHEKSPVRLSGVFFDELGRIALVIKNNEYWANSGMSDITFVGNTLFIRNKLTIVLEMEISPPLTFVIKKIDMNVFGNTLQCDDDKIVYNKYKGAKIILSGSSFLYHEVALEF